MKDVSSSPLTVVPFVVTSDFTGPIPWTSQVRMWMLTEMPAIFSASVSSTTVAW